MNIFYFSGTGNSLFIAKELAKRIPEINLIPIIHELHRKTPTKNVGAVGFIFPCHGLTIPIPVKRFMNKIDVTNTNYLFGICTRGGSIFLGFKDINKILKKQNKSLNSQFAINMGLNDPKLKFFKKCSQEELDEIEKKALHSLNQIESIIKNRENLVNSQSEDGVGFSRYKPINFILKKLVKFATNHVAPYATKNYFYADEKCTGCGICEKVCLSQKIKIINGKPLWTKKMDCYLCYPCLNYCPSEAVQIKSKFYMKSFTPVRGRYSHPYAKYTEISKQRTDSLND